MTLKFQNVYNPSYMKNVLNCLNLNCFCITIIVLIEMYIGEILLILILRTVFIYVYYVLYIIVYIFQLHGQYI